jgi:hypothetical protein
MVKFTIKKQNKPMAPTILDRGLPICGLRPIHVCEWVHDYFNSAYRSFETWFIFYKIDCQFNAKPSEKDQNLPGIQTRDLWISTQQIANPADQVHNSTSGRKNLRIFFERTHFFFRKYNKLCTEISGKKKPAISLKTGSFRQLFEINGNCLK